MPKSPNGLLGNGKTVLYVNHIEARGRPFFEKVCELDLEGIVAKRKSATYRATEKPSPYWVKIKNPKYSQAERREELFERKNPDYTEPRVGLKTAAYIGYQENVHLEPAPNPHPKEKARRCSGLSY